MPNIHERMFGLFITHVVVVLCARLSVALASGVVLAAFSNSMYVDSLS